MAVSWLFPGKIIQIDAPCLDCGEALCLEMKDGQVLNEEALGFCAYVSVPLSSQEIF
jgi:hypothetical protein